MYCFLGVVLNIYYSFNIITMSMDAFKAYRYYSAIKLHFSSPKYNVFQTRGRVKCSAEKFALRNDYSLFERVGRKFTDDREYIKYLASNFMYRNANVIYDDTTAQANFKEYIRRRQSITKIFTDDLNTIALSGATYYDFSGKKIPDILQLYMSNKITLETLVILNDLDGFVDSLKGSERINLLLGDELLRIEKSKGFVKYDPYKVMDSYVSFLDEVKENNHGSHVS